IVYRYGDALAPGTREFVRRFPTERGRWYVRVDYSNFAMESEDLEETVRSWYGLIDVELDRQLAPELAPEGGSVTAYPRGRNYFLAYDLKAILAASWIDRTAISDGEGEKYVGRALAFNPGLVDYNPDPAETTGEGNRSDAAPFGSYVFHDRRTGGKTWSTFDASGYLLQYAPCRNFDDKMPVPFYLEDVDGALPTWDKPIEACEWRTVFDVLNALISRQRGL